VKGKRMEDAEGGSPKDNFSDILFISHQAVIVVITRKWREKRFGKTQVPLKIFVGENHHF
jgi:hypothetical protein